MEFESSGKGFLGIANPKLKDTTVAVLDKYQKIKSFDQPKKITFTAYDSMRKKVCKKYAKF